MRLGVPVGQIPSEEEYFHRLDCQLIDEMRERAAAEEERRRMAETSRIEDPRVLEALERLGYTHNNFASSGATGRIGLERWLGKSCRAARHPGRRCGGGLKRGNSGVAATRGLAGKLSVSGILRGNVARNYRATRFASGRGTNSQQNRSHSVLYGLRIGLLPPFRMEQPHLYG